MLHLRILIPQDLTPLVEALLRREPAAVHLSIVRGAAVEPTGDLIEVDVEHAALATLISRLEDLGVARRGSFPFAGTSSMPDLTPPMRPAAADNVGVALALGNLDEALGALPHLVINLAGLVVAGVGSLWIGRRLSRARAIAEFQRRRGGKRDVSRRATGPSDAPRD